MIYATRKPRVELAVDEGDVGIVFEVLLWIEPSKFLHCKIKIRNSPLSLVTKFDSILVRELQQVLRVWKEAARPIKNWHRQIRANQRIPS